MGAAAAAVGAMAHTAPVLIRDDFAPPELLRAAAATWPRADWPYWHRYDDQCSRKFATRDPDRLPRAAQQLVDRIAELPVGGDAFPDFDLHGAGLHMLPPGGFLGRHRDGARHPLTDWTRIANAILFIDEWQDDWGGQLCFYDDDGRETARVAPAFNRLALFRTPEVWHSVLPVTGPVPRRTITLFWWSLQPSTQQRNRAEFACTPQS